ncbi:cytochrome P450 9b2-like [Hermetia illucens]|nr:cytochrome P450 9b2-like [Hermetia illucens]
MEGEDNDKSEGGERSNQSDSLTDDEIVVQCMIILMDGLIKSSVVATGAVLEIANNPGVQAKLLKEIDTISGRVSDKSISYDTLREMDYLDMIIYEALRKWSVEHILDRICTKPYTLYDKTTGHSVNLEPGETICIPIAAFHRDPNYFPDPERFYPERFSEEKRGFIRPYTFLPFGIGPRNCIGAKLALMQMKAAMVSLFSEFTVEPLSPKTAKLVADSTVFFLQPENGPTVRLICRKTK